MRARHIAAAAERAVLEKGWLRLLLTLFVIPPAFLLSIRLLGSAVIAGWLVVLVAYSLTLFVAAIAGAPGKRKIFSVARTLLAFTGPLVWGLLLAVIYYFSYVLLVDPKNISPD